MQQALRPPKREPPRNKPLRKYALPLYRGDESFSLTTSLQDKDLMRLPRLGFHGTSLRELVYLPAQGQYRGHYIVTPSGPKIPGNTESFLRHLLEGTEPSAPVFEGISLPLSAARGAAAAKLRHLLDGEKIEESVIYASLPVILVASFNDTYREGDFTVSEKSLKKDDFLSIISVSADEIESLARKIISQKGTLTGYNQHYRLFDHGLLVSLFHKVVRVLESVASGNLEPLSQSVDNALELVGEKFGDSISAISRRWEKIVAGEGI